MTLQRYKRTRLTDQLLPRHGAVKNKILFNSILRTSFSENNGTNDDFSFSYLTNINIRNEKALVDIKLITVLFEKCKKKKIKIAFFINVFSFLFIYQQSLTSITIANPRQRMEIYNC